MFKLAALALATTLAAGTTYVVAHGPSSRPIPAAVQTAGTTVEAAPRPSARGPLTPLAFRRIAFVGLGTTARTGTASLTCVEVGAHMADLAFAGATDLPPAGPVRDANIEHAAKHFEDVCTTHHWSADYMACVMGSPDAYSTMLDCAPYATADVAEDPHGPQPEGSFVIDSRKDPVAPTADTSCAGVAKHVFELTEPDPASVAALPADKRDAVTKGIEASRKMLPAQMEKGCTDAGWTEARRTCIAASTTVAEMQACE